MLLSRERFAKRIKRQVNVMSYIIFELETTGIGIVAKWNTRQRSFDDKLWQVLRLTDKGKVCVIISSLIIN